MNLQLLLLLSNSCNKVFNFFQPTSSYLQTHQQLQRLMEVPLRNLLHFLLMGLIDSPFSAASLVLLKLAKFLTPIADINLYLLSISATPIVIRLLHQTYISNNWVNAESHRKQKALTFLDQLIST